MSIESIALWHKRARPEPTEPQWEVQLGCHLEEVVEMLDCINTENGHMADCLATARMSLTRLADAMKDNRSGVYTNNLVEMVDALADQIVTAVGVAHCEHMNIVKAVEIVNESNWSKYDYNGQPIFSDKGKITKGPQYIKPDLSDCV